MICSLSVSKRITVFKGGGRDSSIVSSLKRSVVGAANVVAVPARCTLADERGIH